MERVTVLAGGVGGARFVRGLLAHLSAVSHERRTELPVVSVIGNTGDDMWLNGLRICPDLDTMMYTLGNGVDEAQGWGRGDESDRTATEISAYGRGWDWFTLGDLDLATHIIRTDMLREGATLTEVTETLCRRWNPGVRLLPMSNQPVETNVRLAKATAEHAVGDLIHFEEWWVRYRAGIPVSEFVQVGLEQARATPEVVDAIETADIIILPPSNPVVSVGTIVAVPGVHEALGNAAAPVIGISPIIGGSAVRGMAVQCLESNGVDPTAFGVAASYGARSNGGLLDGWLVDEADAVFLPQLDDHGIRGAAVPLWMTNRETTATMAAETLALAASLPLPRARKSRIKSLAGQPDRKTPLPSFGV
ncbi:LPPG:FO 2-phospho-L-lactate transferase [Paenarthrobacter nicotinovorans]|uniref:2-phospho-L-lactate transferase n=1 Tax=Micrococcaceae TaxID=1268 RepID=UPI0008771A9E|nr:MULTISPECIES: 2-phospho-L-lactate transferase [Micrococcaceae]MDR6438723.1 LPPG:FO 2-phospho-L-lactate transferase [Paenarthrobacter nicotinovorans]SCZ56471.1 LPPG:FO 2-phospho-L-lactate transferase [Arthrobacter sp. UNCCL28]